MWSESEWCSGQSSVVCSVMWSESRVWCSGQSSVV
uniref:Uncharacterized protein n=1 Tax=Anguilla anguilla TaxID=7936 RepID=A0A0E9W4I7_ANGAN